MPISDKELSKLSIGDTIYQAQDTLHSLNRTKIHQVIDGEDWFRYSTPIRTWKIKKFTLVAIIKKVCIGNLGVNHDEDTADQFFFQTEQSNIVDLTHDVGFDFGYYSTLELAQKCKNQEEKNARDLDLKGVESL